MGALLLQPFATAEDLSFNNNDRVVILGDTPARANQWSNYLAAYLILRNPDKQLHIQTEATIGAVAGDFLADGSHADTAKQFYPKAVLPYRPKVVIAQLGNSDAGSKAAFKADVQALIDNHIAAVQLGGNAAPILIAPTPIIAVGGGTNLSDYEAALGEIATAENLPFANVWTDLQTAFTNPANEAVLDNGSSLPKTAGQILIAKSIIDSLGWGVDVSSATLNASTLATTAATQCAISGTVANSHGGIDFRRLDNRLPWAFDATMDWRDNTNWDHAAAIDPTLRDWQQYTLTVSDLTAGSYEIYMDDIWVGELTHTQLAAGWNMADLRYGSVWEKCQTVLSRIRDMHDRHPTLNLDWSNINSYIPGKPSKLSSVPANRSPSGVNGYKVAAEAAYVTTGLRGQSLIDALVTPLADIAAKDLLIWQAARPETIRFSLRRKGFATYVPPVGIPAPSFGINEQRPARTHYVDNTHPSATDTANPNGSPTTPRRTFPRFPAAGSSIEIHGGPYNWTWGPSDDDPLEGALVGTEANPIFIWGADPNNRPIIQPIVNSDWGDNNNAASYVVIENLHFDYSPIRYFNGPAFSIFHGSHHVAIRQCWFSGAVPHFDSALVNLSHKSGSSPAQRINNIVFYNNHFSENGSFSPLYETGMQSFTVNNGCQHIWVLGNSFFRETEDGVHMAYVGGNGPAFPDGGKEARNIYVGNNRFVEAGENGLDIKNAKDVVVSTNVFRGMTNWRTTGANGEAIVVNDEGDNDRIWILNNHFINCLYGTSSQNSQPLDGFQDIYILGNLYEDSPRSAMETQYTGGGYAFAGTSFAGYFMGNTLVRMDKGFYCRGGAGTDSVTPTVFIKNNIFYGRLSPASPDVSIGTQSDLVAEQAGNLAFPAFIEAGNEDWTGVIIGDPQFVGSTDPTALLKYHDKSIYALAPNSPARDQGASDITPFSLFSSLYGLDISYDIRGLARPDNGSYDIGALEGNANLGNLPERPSQVKGVKVLPK